MRAETSPLRLLFIIGNSRFIIGAHLLFYNGVDLSIVMGDMNDLSSSASLGSLNDIVMVDYC